MPVEVRWDLARVCPDCGVIGVGLECSRRMVQVTTVPLAEMSCDGRDMLAALRAVGRVRDGHWIRGAVTHVLAEFLTVLEHDGWRLLPAVVSKSVPRDVQGLDDGPWEYRVVGWDDGDTTPDDLSGVLDEPPTTESIAAFCQFSMPYEHLTVERRRPAGDWIPVPAEGDEHA